MKRIFSSNYISRLLDHDYCNRVYKFVWKEVISKYQFDTFVGIGLSGTTMALMLAHRFKKKVILVRKADTDCHSDRRLEGSADLQVSTKAIIVDDCISSGRTLLEIIDVLNDSGPYELRGVDSIQIIGLFLYSEVLPWQTAQVTQKLGECQPERLGYHGSFYSFISQLLHSLGVASYEMAKLKLPNNLVKFN